MLTSDQFYSYIEDSDEINQNNAQLNYIQT